MTNIERESDEDKLIAVLKRHRDLKQWIMAQLLSQGINCQETYRNDEKGDIKLLNSKAIIKVQAIIDTIDQQFNATSRLPTQVQATKIENPHLEIKTQYLYGQEAVAIMQQGTVIGIASANRISQPSQVKLKQAGITFAENIPSSVFSQV
jgi:hypothetical protein